MIRSLLALAFVTAGPGALAAEPPAVQTCMVTAVHDGDTLTATCAGTKTHIRLAEIDAPELKQPYGTASGAHLRRLCAGSTAIVQESGKDRYGRSIAHVQCNGVDAGREQIRSGLAWAYDRYLVDHSLLDEQRIAREKHLGLWKSKNPVAPWKWRAGAR